MALLLEGMRVSALTLALFVAAGEALGAATIESIGAEKCGGRVNAFEVEFLAPESAPLEATAEGAGARGAEPGSGCRLADGGRKVLHRCAVRFPGAQG